jgi:phosphoglycolate phosphatase
MTKLGYQHEHVKTDTLACKQTGNHTDPKKQPRLEPILNLVFFDIDGTLLLSQGAGGRSIVRTMRSVFETKEEIARIEIHGQTDRGIATQLFQAHGIDDTEQNWNRFAAGYLEILGDELCRCEGSLLPGIPVLLPTLQANPNIELALLTGNLQKGAVKKIKHFGIETFFTWGGFGDRHRDRSDLAQNAMELAASNIEIDRLENIFVIGDTPNDIRCGKAISATTIAVATSDFSYNALRSHSPDFVLKDLSDLDQVVSILS